MEECACEHSLHVQHHSVFIHSAFLVSYESLIRQIPLFSRLFLAQSFCSSDTGLICTDVTSDAFVPLSPNFQRKQKCKKNKSSKNHPQLLNNALIFVVLHLVSLWPSCDQFLDSGSFYLRPLRERRGALHHPTGRKN